MAHDIPSDDVPSDDVPTDGSFLATLAESLCEAMAAGGADALVHVKRAPDGDGYEVGTRPLDGHRPADVLLGLVAPEDWIALGVAGHGRPLTSATTCTSQRWSASNVGARISPKTRDPRMRQIASSTLDAEPL